MYIWAFSMCPGKSFPTHSERKALQMKESLGGTQISLGFVQRVFGAIEAGYYNSRQIVLSHVGRRIQTMLSYYERGQNNSFF